MNKSLRLFGTAAMVLLLAVSCKKDEKNNIGEKQMMTFSAGIEQGNSKTGLTPNGDHSYGQVWKANDKINVNGDDLYLKDGAESANGTFEGEAEKGGPYYAVYGPDASVTKVGLATFTLPETQYYNGNDYPTDEDGNPLGLMYAKSESTDLGEFENLCGLMQLNFYSGIADKDLKVNKIVVSEWQNTEGGSAFSGTGTVDLTAATPALVLPRGAKGSRSVTLVCDGDGDGVVVSKDSENSTPFLIALPPFTFPADEECSMMVQIWANDVKDGSYLGLKYAGAVTVAAGEVAYTTKQLLPTVIAATSSTVSSLTATTATVGGTTSALDYGACITETGVYYGTSQDVLSMTPVSTGTPQSEVSVNLTGLTPNTDYYARVYAKGHYRDGGEFEKIAAANKFTTLETK